MLKIFDGTINTIKEPEFLIAYIYAAFQTLIGRSNRLLLHQAHKHKKMISTCVCLISDVTVAPADALSEVSLPALSSSSAGLGERGQMVSGFAPRVVACSHTPKHTHYTTVWVM